MFNHKFLDKLVLEQINSPTGRKYKTSDGMMYKSVTTWLNELNPHKLDDWKKFVGEDKAKLIAEKAAQRGTTLHGNIEKYLLNEEVKFNPVDMLNKSMFNSIKKELHHIDNIMLLESPLYSDILRLAGTVDCVAEWDGVSAVIDFKSSTNVKDREQIESYWLQTSIYSIMVQERYGINISKLVILISNEYMPATVYVGERSEWVSKLAKHFKENRP